MIPRTSITCGHGVIGFSRGCPANRVYMVPRCLGWVETSLRGQPQVELAGQQVDDGLEVTG